MRASAAFESVMQDIRYAIRTMGRSPAFSATVVATLALGIGANTAIFSLVDAVLLRMLPVMRPEQLYFLETSAVQVGSVSVSRAIENAQFQQVQARATKVAAFGAFMLYPRLQVGVDGQTELASAHLVSGTYFRALGVQPILGRALGAGDDNSTGRVVVLSYGYWRRRFGGDPAVVGRPITINSVPFTIAGVAPRDFHGLTPDPRMDLLLPIGTKPQVDDAAISSKEQKPDDMAGITFARLGDTVPPAAAAAELSVLLRQATTSSDAALQNRAVTLTPASRGMSGIRGQFSEPLRILMVVVALVMLIACANIANLLLARGSAREREIAIRMSLGSSRWRLIRQLLTESLLLALCGALAGIPVAMWARAGIVYLALKSDTADSLPLEWNFRLIAFTVAMAVVTGLLFGIAPALRATGLRYTETLRGGLRGGRTGRGLGRIPLGRILVAGQVALSLALVVGAALFLSTFRNLDRTNVGYDRDHSLLLTVDPSLAGYTDERASALFGQILERLHSVQGVRSASVMQTTMLAGQMMLRSFVRPGYALQPGEDDKNFWVISNPVGPHFLKTAGVHLVTGRDFEEGDNQRAPKVTVINEAMARHFFAGRNPIGQHINSAYSKDSFEIIGIIRDIKYVGLRPDKQEVMLMPIAQLPANTATLLVRTAGEPLAMLPAVRAVISEVDAKLPIYDVTTMEQQVQASMAKERMLATLATLFGVLALALSAIGLYGVLSYGVVQRTGEIGIRMALGARRGNIIRLVLGDTALVLIAGIAAGIGLALAGGRLIQSMLFGVSATDAISMIGAACILAAVATLAGYLPARRACRVDPMVALRHE